MHGTVEPLLCKRITYPRGEAMFQAVDVVRHGRRRCLAAGRVAIATPKAYVPRPEDARYRCLALVKFCEWVGFAPAGHTGAI
jgi:hypothetical protein